ncbi:MAG: DMT family transporter [Bacillota bacterium]
MASPGTEGGRPVGVLLATAATVFFASAAVLVRSAPGLPPAGLAAGRLLVGAAFVALLGLLTRTPMGIRPRELPALAGIAAVAALHFLFYILALERTNIAHTLVLVNLSPVFVAALSPWWLGERLRRGQSAGLGLAVAGLAVMVGFEPRLTMATATGDALALGSGLMYAVYSLAGRSTREKHPLFRYAFWVYLLAAVLLWPFGRPAATLAALRGPSLIAVLLLGLLPTGLGHTLYNASLRRAPAAMVNLIATQEVTGGVLLGYIFFREGLTAAAAVGGALALVGVALVTLFAQTSMIRQPGGTPPGPSNTI